MLYFWTVKKPEIALNFQRFVLHFILLKGVLLRDYLVLSLNNGYVVLVTK